MKRIIPIFLALALVVFPLQMLMEDIAQASSPALVPSGGRRSPIHSQFKDHTRNPDYAILVGVRPQSESLSIPRSGCTNRQARLLLVLALFLAAVCAWFTANGFHLISQYELPCVMQRIIRCIHFTYGL